MKPRWLILAAVLAAVGGVLWLKTMGPTPTEAGPTDAAQPITATVLLFADPREAGENCGCAEVIRMVRALRGTPGVRVREIDSRSPGDDARRYSVRTSPAVLILDATGNEQSRFEGESPATIAALRAALTALGPSPNPTGAAAAR